CLFELVVSVFGELMCLFELVAGVFGRAGGGRIRSGIVVLFAGFPAAGRVKSGIVVLFARFLSV
ncbi:hypothetical protein, partial [Paenibacillus phytohabitans]